VSRFQKGETNLDFTEARGSEWQWHQLGHMQVCTSLQADNHTNTPPVSFLQAGCPSCHPTNSVKALKARAMKAKMIHVLELRYLFPRFNSLFYVRLDQPVPISGGFHSPLVPARVGGSVAEWLACWTQAQKGLGLNRSRDAVG